MFKIGRRIVVYGPTGSGKTTMAGSIAQSIRVPHIELDAIFWTPDWVSKPDEEFRAEVSAVLSSHSDGWVSDGNYRRVRGLVLPLVDTVVWLRLPFRVVFSRLLKRTVSRAWSGEILWGTNREPWRRAFLSRDSLLLYAVTHWCRHHEAISQALEQTTQRALVLRLHSVHEVEEFVVSLPPAVDRRLNGTC